ncbi:uncharacterized protein LOC143033004 [Oratosquilla oratoria]|uniref:uncharacterized protein LOC143033004 n=1 Tax=Oratosquilla oratoria TaxID=337810 RepID=UPI003F7648C2
MAEYDWELFLRDTKAEYWSPLSWSLYQNTTKRGVMNSVDALCRNLPLRFTLMFSPLGLNEFASKMKFLIKMDDRFTRPPDIIIAEFGTWVSKFHSLNEDSFYIIDKVRVAWQLAKKVFSSFTSSSRILIKAQTRFRTMMEENIASPEGMNNVDLMEWAGHRFLASTLSSPFLDWFDHAAASQLPKGIWLWDSGAPLHMANIAECQKALERLPKAQDVFKGYRFLPLKNSSSFTPRASSSLKKNSNLTAPLPVKNVEEEMVTHGRRYKTLRSWFNGKTTDPGYVSSGKRLVNNLWWRCLDNHHTSTETNANDAMMILNFLCNRHDPENRRRRYCCS